MGGGMSGGGMGDNSDALIVAQQAEEEQAKAEAEAAAASLAADQAEVERVKEMRAEADAEVAADLDSKYSDEPDQVIWHPDVDAVLYGGLDDGKDTEGEAKGVKTEGEDDDEKDGFANHMDKKMGLKDGDDTNDEDASADEDASEEEVAKKSPDDDENADETGKKQSLAGQAKMKSDVPDEGDPERQSKKKPKSKESTAGPASGKIIIKT